MKSSTMKEIEILISEYPRLSVMRGDLLNALGVLIHCYKNSGKLLVCGNGGSAADSLHIVGELMKSFVLKRPMSIDISSCLKKSCPEEADYYISNLQGALPAISLVNEVGLITAYSNDMAPDLAFAQQVLGYGKTGDVLFAISTSGNSTNVIHAANIARALNMQVISLTGSTGGKLKDISNVLLAVPEKETYRIQELHLPIYHALCLALENEFFGG